MTVNEEIISENEKELAAFASAENAAISPVLTRVLEEIRQTGVPYYQWPHLRALLVARLKVALDETQAADKSGAVTVGWSPTNKEKYEERRQQVAEQLTAFDGPPFTLQRLTEVILEPHKSYKNLNKLFNALEKLLSVTSTIPVADPRRQDEPVVDENEPPAAITVSVSPVSPAPAPQVVAGAVDGDVVAKAPWSTGEASS
ncbi:hypothetical protein Poli38472_008846 [Pythium oligandrum]|uniref:Uncharacterized protein n=1 Tax=Pythium oligandrum TaxID=41045 RepID=A0A8K1C4J3_PYTOL|nr:hypothetical protein Poli38472_008846 [Pythium oligandrum]|eukprot:TMW56198.1 hypothetical protein Poli38472_008846 [Pythium oligandrum]